jgi:hypothetical protein
MVAGRRSTLNAQLLDDHWLTLDARMLNGQRLDGRHLDGHFSTVDARMVDA